MNALGASIKKKRRKNRKWKSTDKVRTLTCRSVRHPARSTARPSFFIRRTRAFRSQLRRLPIPSIRPGTSLASSGLVLTLMLLFPLVSVVAIPTVEPQQQVRYVFHHGCFRGPCGTFEPTISQTADSPPSDISSTSMGTWANEFLNRSYFT